MDAVLSSINNVLSEIDGGESAEPAPTARQEERLAGFANSEKETAKFNDRLAAIAQKSKDEKIGRAHV